MMTRRANDQQGAKVVTGVTPYRVQFPFQPGDVLGNGRYTHVKHLSDCGQGSVHQVKDNSSGEFKVLKFHLESGGFPIERLVQEGELLQRIKHPNLPRSESVERFAGLPPCIVMEFIPGSSLDRVMGGGLPWNEAVEILGHVLDALTALHEHGVIHRDIKPQNIIRGEGRVTVVDLGLAKCIKPLFGLSPVTTEANASSFIGTPRYAAPEAIWRHAPISCRSDLFGVGAVLVAALTGCHFDRGLWATSLGALDLPASLVKLIQRALSLNPHDRPRSALAMRKELDRVTQMRSYWFDWMPCKCRKRTELDGRSNGG